MRISSLLALAVLSGGALACDPPAQPEAPTSSAPNPIPPESQPAASASGPTAPAPPPSPDAPPATPPAPAEVAKLARSSNAFGFDLYARLRSSAGNLILSPASITTALAMTWGGAKGETAAEMQKVLHLDGSPAEIQQTSGQLARALEAPNQPITFRIANQLFGEKSFQFEQPYLEQIEAAYGAPLERLDFMNAPEPSRKHINGWVEGKTEKKITELVPAPAIDKETRLVLVNAIYFLGDWMAPFEKDATRPAPFFVTKTTKKDVPTMNRTGSYPFVKKGGMTAAELPYRGGSMSMLIVLPDAVDGLDKMEADLDESKLDELVKALSVQQVWVQLPKFEVKPAESLSLGDHLVALGMPTAFDRRKADFTGIANPPNPDDRLFIGKVFHKGFVRVDEKGTEAAAATAVVMPRAGSAPAEPVELKVDRPFLFFVRDNASGLILFMGRVVDPTLTS